RFIQRNVLVSNLGIIVKGGASGKYQAVVTDLRTAAPVEGARLDFYDFQQQLIGSSMSDDSGFSRPELSGRPLAVVASKGSQTGYLRLQDGDALSTSRFDVSGTQSQKGLKGFIYGERGVWRPGDSVYLHFVLDDSERELPGNYPVTFELRDPKGRQLIQRVVSENYRRIYPLHFATGPEDPTGSWMARVKAGGAVFEKILPIETVKPNRISIELDTDPEELSAEAEPTGISLEAQWLHGATASGLRATINTTFSEGSTTFRKHPSFHFEDPARNVESTEQIIFDGALDESGSASFQRRLYSGESAPGKLDIRFETRVYERSGDFSTDYLTLEYDPYPAYSGVEIPENEYGEKRLDIGEEQNIRTLLVDREGNPLSRRQLSIGLYRVEWRWWWERGSDNISNFNSSNHFNAISRDQVTTDSEGLASWPVEISEWGRYMLRVCDTEGGHCAGDFFYAGYPWYGDDDAGREAEAVLAFTSDKKTYAVGEDVTLSLPTAASGRLLISLENASGVIRSFWTDTQEGETKVTFPATPEMAPTVYAYAALIQRHGQTENDLPIRMYGLMPLEVEDPATHLHPEIEMPEELQPKKKFTVSVSESDDKPMAYTLAMVDEGLLSLTRFQTPDPHDAFYAREALGVKTWDIYDFVLGAYGGEMNRVLSIGGDGDIRREAAENRANRFEPVVRHLGPFQLAAGEEARHEIEMPNYVGAVRVMVVASSRSAYGAAEKTVPVRQPLMALATLPRVLGPGERSLLPVNIFRNSDQVQRASVSVEASGGLIEWLGPKSREVSFEGKNEKLVFFEFRCREQTGI
ncbi:MAG: MG2 domain-containing protein, partial [Saprospiraceae bacterium]|nr:MG2 domain-containing protein [Saprospiraceae bacterium]